MFYQNFDIEKNYLVFVILLNFLKTSKLTKFQIASNFEIK